MALVLDHLSLTILGTNLGRKRMTMLASTAAIAASTTLATLTAMSSLELDLLSVAKSIGLVVVLLLHLRLERLLHWEQHGEWGVQCTDGPVLEMGVARPRTLRHHGFAESSGSARLG